MRGEQVCRHLGWHTLALMVALVATRRQLLSGKRPRRMEAGVPNGPAAMGPRTRAGRKEGVRAGLDDGGLGRRRGETLP